MVTHGLSCYDVAGLLGQDSRTVERWVQRFEPGASPGCAMHEGDRSSRARRLDPAQWDAINRGLRRPREFGCPQYLWNGKLLPQAHGVILGVSQCQRLFRQPDLRLGKPCPLIAYADPAAQATYKNPVRPRRRV